MQSESECESDPALINGVKRTEKPQNEPHEKKEMESKENIEKVIGKFWKKTLMEINHATNYNAASRSPKQIFGIRLQITKIIRHISA